MKKIILIFSFCILMVHENKLNAQATSDFNHTAWLMSTSFQPYSYWFSYLTVDSISPDTVINAVTYKKISDGYMYRLGIRSDNHKLYGIDEGGGSLPHHEYLMYGFSANMGDTVNNVVIGGSPFPPYYFTDTVNAYIVAKDSFLLNNKYYMALEVELIFPLGGNLSTAWEENIGSGHGLIDGIYSIGYISNLKCYSNNDSVPSLSALPHSTGDFTTVATIPISQGNPCFFIPLNNGIAEINNEQSTIEISPNPTTSNFTINLNKPYTIIYIEITNVVGEVVRSFDKLRMTPDDKSVTIDMSSEAKGLYFVSVRTNEATQVVKVVKE